STAESAQSRSPGRAASERPWHHVVAPAQPPAAQLRAPRATEPRLMRRRADPDSPPHTPYTRRLRLVHAGRAAREHQLEVLGAPRPIERGGRRLEVVPLRPLTGAVSTA